MYCSKCGHENADEAGFCQKCGTSLKEPSQTVVNRKTLVNKRVLALVGVLGGILALVGVFSAWVTIGGWGSSAHVSAWDSINQATIAGAEVQREGWAIVALVGAVLLALGALFALAAPYMEMLWGIVFIGGIAAIAGCVWALADIDTGSVMGVSVGYGSGLYLTLVGGILGLSGAFGLRR